MRLTSVLFRPVGLAPALKKLATASRVLVASTRNNPGATPQYNPKGRGVGSGRGRYCGRGNSGGQVQRGSAKGIGFEGGQLPFYRSVPMWGLIGKAKTKRLEVINLSKIQYWIDQGRLNPNETITMKTLVDVRLLSRVKYGVKLLSEGADWFKAPITIEVSRASRAAIEAIERVGGKITTVYYSRVPLRGLLFPHKFRVPPRPAYPKTRRDVAYYTSEDVRGYLRDSPIYPNKGSDLYIRRRAVIRPKRTGPKTFFSKKSSKHFQFFQQVLKNKSS